jgi:hypothetical protein
VRLGLADCRATALLVLALALGLAGCDAPVRGQAAAEIARDGFARDPRAVRAMVGQRIEVRGFVDHGNLYGDSGAREILAEYWSGEGTTPGTWRFDLKSAADDALGHGFAVIVPNGPGRDALLRRLVADARAGRPTAVLVRGRLSTFAAPTNLRRLTGLVLVLESPGDLVPGPPGL